MMNKCTATFLFFLVAKISFAQNLISNSGFETYSALPTSAAQYNLATGWTNCNGTGSPDYFSILGSGLAQLPNCFIGTVNPNSGDGCMGAALYYYSPPDFREYLSTQLLSPLVPGQTYNVNFYVTNGVTGGNYGGGGIDNISAAFSTQPLTQPGMGPIPVIPQVTYGTIYYSYTWQLLSMQFVADSAYNFITIGNFSPDAATAFQQFDPCPSFGAYYFFDDLTVEAANVQPNALFNAPNHICPGTCTGFNNLSTNATSYQWTFAGANPPVSADSSPSNICYNSPGSYSVQLIASNSVTSDTLTLNNYITVYPYPSPQGILQSGDTLTANQGAISYQWYKDGNMIPGATDYFYVAATGGNYNVVATDSNGCEVEAAIFDVVAAVEAAVKEKTQLHLYPNPVKETLFFNCDHLTGTAVKISVYNILGVEIYSNALPVRAIDFSAFPAGTYFIEAAFTGSSFRTIFLKQ
jgi:hypothetical protein